MVEKLALTRDELIGLEQQTIPRFAGLNLGQVLGGGATVFSVSSLLFWLAGTLLLIYLIFGGYKLMTSAGDPKKIAEAKQTITHAIIGMLIVFVAYWIVQIVVETLKLDVQNAF